MPEFRIENNALKRETRFRMLSWGVVLLLTVIAAVLFILRASGYIGDSSNLGGLFVLAIFGAAVTAIVLAPREGLHRAERKMVFVLEDDAIVRKRQGYPDVRIPFPEINTLSEELGRLIITSVEPRRKIGIPYSVSRYEEIRTELTRHCHLSARMVLPWKNIVLPVITFVSWGAVLWLQAIPGVIAAGGVAVCSLAFGSYRLWATLRYNRKRPLLLWIPLGSIWLAALLLIYIRVVRLMK
ncbi:MAG TPA: hypothetical protein VN684_08445 [Terriglobales bacterium]|jgi:hypothetical protein|nr:hypothetical protein [Terriglobales bacterium]